MIDGLWNVASYFILSDANKNVIDTMMRVKQPPRCVLTSYCPPIFHCGIYLPNMSKFFRKRKVLSLI